MYCQNVRSLRGKGQEFFASSSQQEFDVVGVTETWLTEDFHNGEYFSDDYHVFRRDRNFAIVGGERGGGVILAVRSVYKCVPVELPHLLNTVANVDIVGCKIIFGVNCFFVFVVYIPPDISAADFDNFLDTFSQSNFFTNRNILIMGDFNVTYLNDTNVNNVKSRLMHNFLSYNDLNQCNGVVNSNGRLLDLVMCSEVVSVNRDDVPLLPEDAHHPALCFELNVKHGPVKNFVPNRHAKTYNFAKADFPSLYAAMMAVDWSFLDSFNDVNLASDAFYGKLYILFDSYVPFFNMTRKHKYPLWYLYNRYY